MTRKKKCEWVEDFGPSGEDPSWLTDCSHSFVFTADGPVENEFKFCPYCGNKLVEIGARNRVDPYDVNA